MYTEPRVADSRGPRQLVVPHWGDGDNRKSHVLLEKLRPGRQEDPSSHPEGNWLWRTLAEALGTSEKQNSMSFS